MLVKTLRRETFFFPRIFARRRAKSCLYSARALAADVGRRYGATVEMMQMKHGIFDDASISVIASDTVREIGRLAG